MDALDDIIGVSETDSQEVSGCDSANIDSVSRSNDLKQKILFSIVVVSTAQDFTWFNIDRRRCSFFEEKQF